MILRQTDTYELNSTSLFINKKKPEIKDSNKKNPLNLDNFSCFNQVRNYFLKYFISPAPVP